jgi:hypothetical protein
VSTDNRREAVGKISDIANQVPNPENALPVNEISVENYEKNIPNTGSQQQDKKPIIVQVAEPVWTDNLGPCHAVCMYP